MKSGKYANLKHNHLSNKAQDNQKCPLNDFNLIPETFTIHLSVHDSEAREFLFQKSIKGYFG